MSEPNWIEDLYTELAAKDARIAELEAEVARAKLNTRQMALLAEMFVYEPNRLSEGGLLAQVQRALTDQDVEYDGLAALAAPPDPKEGT